VCPADPRRRRRLAFGLVAADQYTTAVGRNSVASRGRVAAALGGSTPAAFDVARPGFGSIRRGVPTLLAVSVDWQRVDRARRGQIHAVELTERALRDALALIGERDGVREAQSALEWMGWEGEGPLLLRRFDVQLFCLYTLPRKVPRPAGPR